MSNELRIVLLILGFVIIGGVYFYSVLEKRKSERQRGMKYQPGDYPTIRTQQEDTRSPESQDAEHAQAADEDAPPPSENAPHASSVGEAEAEKQSNNKTLVKGKRFLKRIRECMRSMLNRFLRAADRKAAQEPESQQSAPDQEKSLLILHICAPADQPFYGSEVVDAAKQIGLSLSDKDGKGYFERTLIDEYGQRSVWFYVTDMLKPGVFDWALFPDSRVQGLSVFAQLPIGDEAIRLFEEMVGTAQALTELLDGAELLDENHSTLTNQTINHMRERLREVVFRQGITKE